MKTKSAEECWEKVVEYSERVLDERFSRGQRALWDHLADTWRACAQRVELLEAQRDAIRREGEKPALPSPDALRLVNLRLPSEEKEEEEGGS